MAKDGNEHKYARPRGNTQCIQPYDKDIRGFGIFHKIHGGNAALEI
jgi:hypothetical protein